MTLKQRTELWALHDALSRMAIYEDDIAWWQARVDAWRMGNRPEHATNGWTAADDRAGLWLRQQHYAEVCATLSALRQKTEAAIEVLEMTQ